MSSVTIIGGGIMGAGIARAMSSAGHRVNVVEPNPSARAAIVREAAARGLGIEATEEIGVAARAELVIEAAPEDLPTKLEIWVQLGQLTRPDAILATNTSSLDIDRLAAVVPGPHRALATHWFNPAYEIECVEVAPGAQTSAKTMDRTLTILRNAGKNPLVVPNVPGFIANRIQFAAVREAMLCVEEGVEPSVVDAVVRTSFAPRLAALGPLANADLGGLDTYLAIFEMLQTIHGDRYAPPPSLRNLVNEGRLGAKAGGGISTYTPEEIKDLVSTRDARLSRVVSALRGESETGTDE